MPKPIGYKHRRDALSALQVKAFKGPGRLNDGAGLSLSVNQQGYARWVYRFTFAGKQRDLFLGSRNDLGLAQARKARDRAADLVSEGQNPADAMNRAAIRAGEIQTASIPTFEQAARAYITKLTPTFKNEKAKQPWELAFFTYAQSICPLAINAITSEHIETILDPIWHTKRETARRVRWRIEKVFSAAIVKGHRSVNPRGELITIKNPAAWKDNLESLLLDKNRKGKVRKVIHHPSMPFAQVPAFMTSLRDKKGLAAIALQLCIMTCTRTSEALGARWDEFDLVQGLWSIPADRMKMDEPHIIPLSEPVLEIMRALPRLAASPFVFPGLTAKKHLSQMSMLMLLRRMESDGVTVHGFRSSFRTWAAECTQFPSEIAELALAHKVGSEVERAYNRSTLLDKRRLLAEAWSDYCTHIHPDNVVSLKVNHG